MIDFKEEYVSQIGFDPNTELYAQTIFSQSNGVIGSRSSIFSDLHHSSPAAFLAGFYDNSIGVPSEIVNLNNEPILRLRIDGTEVSLEKLIVPDRYERKLSYKNNLQTYFFPIYYKNVKVFDVYISQFVDLVHEGMIRTMFRFENVNNQLRIQLLLTHSKNPSNGYMGNTAPNIRIQHLEQNELKYSKKTGWSSKWKAINKRKLYCNFKVDNDYMTYSDANRFGYLININKEMHLSEVRNYSDSPIVNSECIEWHQSLKNSSEILQKRLKKHKIKVNGNSRIQSDINFAIHQLVQQVSPNMKVQNIPSRGYTSEYHSGHFFFNTEFFKFEYFALTEPSIAKSMLMFRKKTLDQAIKNAKSIGKKGAFFPEEVDIKGRPASASRIRDIYKNTEYYENSGEEKYFITAAVVYAIDYYIRATNDTEFLKKDGNQMIYQCAKFSESLFKRIDGKYEIQNVMGPDEFHYHVNNSYFVNWIMAWVLQTALDKEVLKTEEPDVLVREKKCSKWSAIINNLYLPPADGNVLQEFDGYFGLKNKHILKEDQNGRPILTSQDEESADKLESFQNQIIKEADLMLLFKLFPDHFSNDVKKETFNYYSKRTAHQSSLSSAPYGVVAADVEKNIEEVLKYFFLSIEFDINYLPKNEFNNGIHLGGYAGALELLMTGICGLKVGSTKTYQLKDVGKAFDSISFPIENGGESKIILIRK